MCLERRSFGAKSLKPCLLKLFKRQKPLNAAFKICLDKTLNHEPNMICPGFEEA